MNIGYLRYVKVGVVNRLGVTSHQASQSRSFALAGYTNQRARVLGRDVHKVIDRTERLSGLLSFIQLLKHLDMRRSSWRSPDISLPQHCIQRPPEYDMALKGGHER